MPFYETEADRENERLVAEQLSVAWNCDFQKLRPAYQLDWMLMRNKRPIGFAELKTRNNSILQYPSLILSLSKWMRGKDLANELNVPFTIIAKYTDGIFWYTASDDRFTYGVGGRNDRAAIEDRDFEPVIYIPTNYFKRAI